MITRKIALSGMRGRKKTTLLLMIVLIFTFLFIAASILLENSMDKTRQNQREKLYGLWHAAYLEADGETAERLQNEPSVTKAAVSEIIGRDEKAGTIGTVNEELMQLGNLVLKEGRLPEQADELLIEASVADELGFADPVGSEITLVIGNTLAAEDMGAYLAEQNSMNGWAGTYKRQLAEKEWIGNYMLNLNSKYVMQGNAGDTSTPEAIQENGLLYDQKIEVNGTFKICGVIQSYSGFWDVGGFQLPGLFLAEPGAQEIENAIRQCTLKDLSDFTFPNDVFLYAERSRERLYMELKEDYESETPNMADSLRAFRKNTYAYPGVSADNGYLITILVIIVIFIVSFCAVLQIFLTQMKRRVRKIALLKSIGATNRQVFFILFWEGVYLLIGSMPIGTAVGRAAGYFGVLLLNTAAGMELVFYFHPLLLLGGVLLGCLALVAGMAVPMIKALHVPLIGTISVTSKKKRRIREKAVDSGDAKRKPLSFAAVSKSHARLNFKGTVLIRVISGVTAVILFSSVYLAYLSFEPYRETVVRQNRPEYILSAVHGYQAHEIKKFGLELIEDYGGKDVTYYQKLNKVCLMYDGMEDSPLISDFRNLMPESRFEDFFVTMPPEDRLAKRAMTDRNGEIIYLDALDPAILGSIKTTLYAVEAPGELYDWFADAVTVGEVDVNSFISGSSVILAIPMYQKSKNQAVVETIPEKLSDEEIFSYVLTEAGGYDLSYDASDKNEYLMDTSIHPGDKIFLSKEGEEITEGPKYVYYDSYDAEVAGIIYYTPNDVQYPFFLGQNGYFMIGSTGLLGKISRSATSNPVATGAEFAESEQQFAFALSQCPTRYGETYINLSTGDGANAVEQASALVQFGKTIGMSFTNYNEENWNLYYRALNLTLILCIFGGTAVVIAMLILWNIHMSAFEQERNRIGVLQAIGVTNREFNRNYLKSGIKTGIFSMIFAHSVFTAILFISQRGVPSMIDYPWMVHGILAVIYVLLLIAVGCGPIRMLKKYAPNENIMA